LLIVKVILLLLYFFSFFYVFLPFWWIKMIKSLTRAVQTMPPLSQPRSCDTRPWDSWHTLALTSNFDTSRCCPLPVLNPTNTTSTHQSFPRSAARPGRSRQAQQSETGMQLLQTRFGDKNAATSTRVATTIGLWLCGDQLRSLYFDEWGDKRVKVWDYNVPVHDSGG